MIDGCTGTEFIFLIKSSVFIKGKLKMNSNTLVCVEPTAEKITRKEVPQYGTPPISSGFQLEGLNAHEDYFLRLSLGNRKASLTVSVGFTSVKEMAGLNDDNQRLTFYTSFTDEQHPIKYRYQVTLDHSDGKMRKVYSWSEAQGTVYFCAFPAMPVSNLTVDCLIGGEVALSEDLCQVWKIAALTAPDVSDIALFRQWIYRRHVELMMGERDMLDENNRTPLHHNAIAIGSSKTTKLILKDYQKFCSANVVDINGQTALHILTNHVGLSDEHVDKSRYSRVLQIIKLLLNDGDASVQLEDNDGNTPLHLACRHYCGGYELIEMLLKSPSTVMGLRNHNGRTSVEECTSHPTKSEQHKLGLKTIFESFSSTDVTIPTPSFPHYTPMMKGGQPTDCNNSNIGVQQLPSITTKCLSGYPAAISEDNILREFNKYDLNRNGYLSCSEVKMLYKSYESFGVTPTDSDVDSTIRSLGLLDDGKITLAEFSILMFKLEAR